MKSSRRRFLKQALGSTAALSIGGILPGFSAKSYAGIPGANERVGIAVMGVNSRGYALAENYAKQQNARILHICDVDSRASAKCIGKVETIQKERPKDTPDFRKALEDKQLDALVIAAPDHWHAPAAILAARAGKHVYLEKPCSHNPHEGELLVAAQKKYRVQIQMGNQRRSWPNVVAAMKELHGGTIGRVYFAKTWYTNNRGPIGRGQQIAVPSWLNYDLWQGPAPRRPYKDNVIHYNWHWFWHWGTGECLNNGTHMIDLARWGLGVTYPVRVVSSGGRYRYNDDWETPDTQVVNLEFGNNTSITWEGRSCNGRTIDGTGAGIIFYGEKGSLLIKGNAYTLFNEKDEVVKEVKNEEIVDPLNLSNPAESLDALHIQDFFSAIRKGTTLAADITGGHNSTLLCQLGNIAQRTGAVLKINPENGHIIGNPDAQRLWKREYEKGWEPVI